MRVPVNGIQLNYEESGSGPAVLLLAGSGASGRVWKLYQVPALAAAGHRVITFDSRGIPPSDNPPGITIDDLVSDAAALIETLDAKPCRVIGMSLGAIVAQELLLRRPGLVSCAVLMATRGRTDAFCAALSAADRELFAGGIALPPRLEAVLRAIQNLSPRTLADETKLRDWLDIFEISPADPSLARAHLGLELIGNRLASYRDISAPCLVLGFEHDLIAPPRLCREVAEHIPDGRYQEIAGCGHFGYLEEPGQVNAAILDFLRTYSGPGRRAGAAV